MIKPKKDRKSDTFWGTAQSLTTLLFLGSTFIPSQPTANNMIKELKLKLIEQTL